MAETTTTPTWVERSVVLTHVLTDPTPTPSLHSQLLVASHVPCFLRWEYPPFLCGSDSDSDSDSDSTSLLLHLRWCIGSLRLFLPRSSWRFNCPFQQPPPIRLSAAVDPPPERWGSAERRAYLRRRRLRRPPLGLRLPPLLLIAAPNLALLALLLWDPLSTRRNPPSPKP